MNTFTNRIALVHNPVAEKLDHKPFVKGGVVEAYVTQRSEERRAGHEHGFVNITRHGEGTCIADWCSATAWSAWWVKEDVYGTGTRTWVEEVERAHRETHDTDMAFMIAASARLTAKREQMLAETEAIKPVDPIHSVVAHLTFDMPARTRRAGLPVPQMQPGVVVSIEEARSRKAMRRAARR